MFEIGVLFSMLAPAEPARVIDDVGVQRFVESQRRSTDGPGRILAQGAGYYDNDQYPDKLIVYTFDSSPTTIEGARGMFAVAFLTEHFDTTEIMFIPESDLIPETVTGYSYKGGELTIRGQKRLPDDAACCPSGIATVSLSFRDGKVVIRTADR